MQKHNVIQGSSSSDTDTALTNAIDEFMETNVITSHSVIKTWTEPGLTNAKYHVSISVIYQQK